MPKFRVRAQEKFVVETVYDVVAGSKEQAEILCKTGQVAYVDKEILEGGEEWLQTLEIEEI